MADTAELRQKAWQAEVEAERRKQAEARRKAEETARRRKEVTIEMSRLYTSSQAYSTQAG